jgi:hypothetical protein
VFRGAMQDMTVTRITQKSPAVEALCELMRLKRGFP